MGESIQEDFTASVVPEILKNDYKLGEGAFQKETIHIGFSTIDNRAKHVKSYLLTLRGNFT